LASKPKSPLEQKLKEKRLSMAEDVEVIELGEGEENRKEQDLGDKPGVSRDRATSNRAMQRSSNLKSIIFLFLIIVNFVASATGLYLWNKERSFYSENLFSLDIKLKEIESLISQQEIKKIVKVSLEEFEIDILDRISKDINEITKNKFLNQPKPISQEEVEVQIKKEAELIKITLGKYFDNVLSKKIKLLETNQFGVVERDSFIRDIDSSNKQIKNQLSNLNTRTANLEKNIVELNLKSYSIGKVKPIGDKYIKDEIEQIDNVVKEYEVGKKININVLTNAFSELAYEALKAEIFVNSEDRFFSMLLATLKSNLIIRSVTPQSGSSLDAILSRAEYQLKRGNLKMALLEMDNLDYKSAEIFSEWRNSANDIVEMN
jgi:hypothetical protein